MIKRLFYGLVSFVCFYSFSAYAQSQVHAGNILTYRSQDTSSRLDHDPRLSLSLSGHFLGLDGRAYAREGGTESQEMEALEIPANMGINSLLLYQVSLDWRVSRRNHLSLQYFWGETSGQGWIGDPIGFNDHFYKDSGQTESKIKLDSIRVGWAYRAYDGMYDSGRYSLTPGMGLRQMRSYVSFAIDDEESAMDTEAIFAPVMPFLSLASEWCPAPGRALGLEIETAPQAMSSNLLTDMPAHGFYYSLDLYGKYQASPSVGIKSGLHWWNIEVDFDGMEDDQDLASNELELWMLGGYVELTFDNPQQAAVAAVKDLLAGIARQGR